MKIRAFTILEIVIVITIIGILAAMVIPAVQHFYPNSTYYKITHRHNDGTVSVILSKYLPYKDVNTLGIKVYPIKGSPVYLSGDIVIEEVKQ